MIRKKHDNKQKGFTLIEVMIAMAFVSIAFLGCAALYTKASMNIGYGDNLSNAAFIAKTTLDRYKNMSATAINILGDGEIERIITNYTGQIGSDPGVTNEKAIAFTQVVTAEKPEGTNGRFINVTVSWVQSNKGRQEVSYNALVRGGGL